MPNWRASYEAEAMIPRFSPPTAIGLPRNRASAACSTDAKKASASRWTMDRCFKCRMQSAECRVSGFTLHSAFFILHLGALPDQGHHHALNLQFFPGNKTRITRVLRAQIRFASLQDKRLEGDLAVNQRRHHVPGARLHAMFDNGNVSIHDAFAEHRIASDS